jgi:4-hydroxy-tetrahydrodipicolinate synthase
MSTNPVGIIPALVSPQDDAGAIQFDELAKLTATMAGAGASGVLVNGHTGELWQLRGKERRETIKICRQALEPDKHVVAGIHAQSPDQFARHAAGALKSGASHILVFPPYLLQRGAYASSPQVVLEYFTQLNALTPLPLVIMQMREETRFMMTDHLLDEVAGLDQVVAIKQEVEDSTRYESNFRILRTGHPDVSILTASHLNMTGNLYIGADGCMAGLANFVPLMAAMLQASAAGDLEKLREWGSRLRPIADAIYRGAGFRSIAKLKYAMFVLGYISGFGTRSPLTPVDTTEQRVLLEVLRDKRDLM